MIEITDSATYRKLEALLKLSLISLLLFLEAICGTTLLTGSTSFYINTLGSEQILHGMIASAILIPLVTYIMHRLLKVTQKYTIIAAIYYLFYSGLTFAAFILYKDHSKASAAILFINAYSGASILTTTSWMLIQRLFNTIEFQKYSSFFFVISCFGVITSGLFIKLVGELVDILFLVKFCLLSAISIFILLFFIHHAFKIQFIHIQPKNTNSVSEVISQLFKHKLLRLILGLTAVQFLLEPCLFYELTFILGQQFQNQAHINDSMATYALGSSSLLLFLSLMLSVLVKIRVKIHYFLVSLGIIMIAVFAILSFSLSWETLLIAAIIRYGTEHSLYTFAYEQLASSLSIQQKTNMKLFIEGGFIPIYYILVTIILTFFKTTESFQILNLILLVACVLFLYGALKLQALYKQHHMDNISAGNEEDLIPSIQALGLEKAEEALPMMIEILNDTSIIKVSDNNSTVTKHNIIAALGNIAKPGTELEIYKAFKIQIAVIQIEAIHALTKFKSFFIDEFLVNALFKHENKLSTLEVRLNLIQATYEIMGNSIVVMLIPSLQDKDYRTIANTIEALSIVKDKRIIAVIKEHLYSPNNRVKSNTAIALYKFKECQELCLQAINKMVKSSETLEIDSASYVIGRLKIHKYKQTLLDLNISTESTKRNVAFALSSLDLELGYKMFAEILVSPNQELAKESIHHYSQLEITARMKIIETAVRLKQNPNNLILLLAASPLDVSTELEFLASYII